ncbi:dipeptide ABC transporter ATP-binding protein [Manganibacter manganicus]|uniref:ABC transporter ATP-binding protein n=1 Tax=Manganibacter manganicus TaxID=1873176 RepID=A0A1V8RMC1_9HYPH|nr:ABC transporter ATP-binding protein [Pseudaminobacter manganicus]OQM74351.1 ABC transporter ATP-binding protein [Pseudaminobacter manganicus]
MSAPVLAVTDLTVTLNRPGGAPRLLLDRVSLDLGKGEVLGLVGESGSGKSLFCRTLVRLLPSRNMQIENGRIMLGEQDLAQASETGMLSVRGGRIGMIFQNPTSHLDPVMSIGNQLSEGLRYHQKLDAPAARRQAIAILRQVGFPDPERQFDAYPHEFSGGMRQRAMIGVALSCNPEILIADEPTTALDVTIQAQILQLLMDIRRERGLSIILITHDLGIVAQTCDRIAVMREGRLIEQGRKRELLRSPDHFYTKTLIGSHPSMPSPAMEKKALTSPPDFRATRDKPLLKVEDVDVCFAGAGSLLGKQSGSVRAVAGASLEIMAGEIVGIVGESGSGKSTLARAILGLTPITSGNVTFDGTSLRGDPGAFLAKLRRETAMVFQDPYNALNPRMTVGEMLAEVLKVQGRIPQVDIPARVGELLDLVELGREFAERRPRSMSGGQCQRAGIARALAVNPRLIIADESTAALDVTIQAQILDLFRTLKEKMQLTLLFIAHDLAIVRNLCDRVVVMNRGQIVEQGTSLQVFEDPTDSYTQALIRAIPDIDPDKSLLPLADREMA